jgi:NDP-sugar pyrophosphorylase family protein
MDAIVLAGGFARRMGELVRHTPKQLLPVAGEPLLAHVLRSLEAVAPDRVLLAVNAAFASQFDAFIASYDGPLTLELAVEQVRAEGEKPGALGALGQLVAEHRLAGPLFIVGGDNLFDFDLARMAALNQRTGDDVIGLYDVGDTGLAQLYGIATLEDGIIVDFVEKPAEPRSTLAATACWLLSPGGVRALAAYLAAGGERDALGHFLPWRIGRATVRGIAYSGTWFDIGDPESYAVACAHFG